MPCEALHDAALAKPFSFVVTSPSPSPRTTTSSNEGGGKEGVRLWVTGLDVGDKALLIDRWDGLDATYEATLRMMADRLYDIVVEYRDTQSTSLMKLGAHPHTVLTTIYGLIHYKKLGAHPP